MSLNKDQILTIVQILTKGDKDKMVHVFTECEVRYLGVPFYDPEIPVMLGLRTESMITYVDYQKIVAISVQREPL